MRRCVAKRTIAYFVIAALLLFVPMCVISLQHEKEEKTQVDILFLGDSLIGQYRDETSVPYLVGQALGKTTFNGAFGGSTMTWYPDENSDYFSSYNLNFPALVKAIVESDFRVQRGTTFRTKGSEDFAQIVDGIEDIDYKNLDVIILEYGTNDYFSGATIFGDNSDYSTLEESFRSGIEEIKELAPNCRMLMVGPTFNWYFATWETCEEIQFGGGYLPEYIEAFKKLCAEYEIEFLDLYYLYNHEYNIMEGLVYTSDGIHPNENGRQMIADAIVDYLNENQ